MGYMSLEIKHKGKLYSGQIATIKRTELSDADHGIVTAYLHTEWRGGGIGVGGLTLDTPERDHEGKFIGRVGTAFGLDHLMRLMETVGVYSWEKMAGQNVIVLFEGDGRLGSTATGIAGLTNEKVFILKDHAQHWLDKEPPAEPSDQ